MYIEESLALRRKRPWRHATAVHREQRRPAMTRNDIWSMDFVADELADGRCFRTLTVIDLFTRECLAIDVGQGVRGQDVAATLERLRFERGLPQRIYCDNGTEFVSSAMDRWAYTNGVILDFSRRGKPTDNATIESFNGRFREECLNVHWFASRPHPQVRAAQLAHQGPHILANTRRREVKLNSRLGTPEMAGFAVSTNGRI